MKLTRDQRFVLQAMHLNDFEIIAHDSDRLHHAGCWIQRDDDFTSVTDIARTIPLLLELEGLIKQVHFSASERITLPKNFRQWVITEAGRDAVRVRRA